MITNTDMTYKGYKITLEQDALLVFDVDEKGEAILPGVTYPLDEVTYVATDFDSETLTARTYDGIIYEINEVTK